MNIYIYIPNPLGQKPKNPQFIYLHINKVQLNYSLKYINHIFLHTQLVAFKKTRIIGITHLKINEKGQRNE